MYRIESLLSARLFLAPQVVGQRLYFISNLSGRLSLYVMDHGGSVPEPLLPPHIALQNPHLIDGTAFYVFPKLGKILVMLDKDGDENYQPMLIPLEGGFPEPAFGASFENFRVHAGDCNVEHNLVYLTAESRTEPLVVSYQGNLATGKLVKLGASTWGLNPVAANRTHERVILVEGYTMGDQVLYDWQAETGEPKLIYGTPLEARQPGQETPLLGLVGIGFTAAQRGLLLAHALFSDTYSAGYLDLADPTKVQPVEITGIVHSGAGVLSGLGPLKDERFAVVYNIDGCSWAYEGRFNEAERRLHLEHVLCGQGAIANGVLESIQYDEEGDRFALSYSTATSPTQLYTIEGADRRTVIQHTREHVLGLPSERLAPGEDASFTSFDGLRISARLYLPAKELGYQGARPVVYYVHGGPQSQERPDFAWFSMPLIQFLTLNGLAVFVPNVRGSTGYGLSYTKRVDRDWGGQDRFDHVHALQLLAKDPRLDTRRAAVVGRSYGGYMTLTLAARHPELWAAAVDMFGPYDLLTFSERIPETWKPYLAVELGDPVKDREFLVERSPRTYMDQLACPLLVIQGKNDPRVVERESRDLVERLRQEGKAIEYLMFENEGHDVLKHENRVTCYNAITDFFKKYLQP
jgi:pimeloyl-ACP methyl ester carboxylesterase